MRLMSIHLARVLAFYELGELNLGGKLFLPDLVEALVKRYRFQANNSTDIEGMKQNGLVFEDGYWEGRSVKKLSFNPALVYLDGEVSTDDSKQILIGMLEWARDELGANYTHQLIRRWGFVSGVIFQTDFPLLLGQSKVLNSVGKKISSAVERNLRQKLDFQPSMLNVGHDPQRMNSSVASLTIQHRLNTLFEENIFFSEAPVPTDLHLEVLEEVEIEFKRAYEGQ
jgi:hypothetical protein